MLDQPFATPKIPLDTAQVRSTAVQQAAAWVRAQEAGLSAVESLTRQWFKHQHDALAAASGAIARLSRCTDLGEAVEIQSDWLASATARAAADLAAIGESALALSQCELGLAARPSPAPADEPPMRPTPARRRQP